MKSSNGVWPWPPALPAASPSALTASAGISARILTTEGITRFTSGDSVGSAIGLASGGFFAASMAVSVLAVSAPAGAAASNSDAVAMSRPRCLDTGRKHNGIGHRQVRGARVASSTKRTLHATRRLITLPRAAIDRSMPERHHQHVAISRQRRIERLDRRHAVEHAAVVDQRRIEWPGEREAAERRPGHVVDGRHAAGDILARDQQHQHPVDAVPVQALGRRPPFLARSGLDAELMDLDMPGGGPSLARRQAVEQCEAAIQDRPHGGVSGDILADRLEPAREATIERVVIAALVVRLMGLARNACRRKREGRMPAPAIAAAVGHVGIEPEVVPAVGEAGPVAEPRLAQDGRHRVGLDEGKALLLQRNADRLKKPAHAASLNSACPGHERAPRPDEPPESFSPPRAACRAYDEVDGALNDRGKRRKWWMR